MKNMLSIYFGSDRTFVTCCEPTPKGLKLNYINSSSRPIDLEDPYGDHCANAVKELNEMIQELGDIEIEKLSVTVPPDAYLISQFPGKQDMSVSEVSRMVNLEIRNAYPQFNEQDFLAKVIPMQKKPNDKQMMMALIFQKLVINSCMSLTEPLGHEINNVEIAQINAHTAFNYNYPEHADKSVALLGIQNNFIDLSVIHEGAPVHYSLVSLKDKEMIGDICIEEFEKISQDYGLNIGAAYFFGEGLTIDMLVIAQSMIMGMGMEMPTGRLNSFRMVESQLGQRERDYCVRTAHMYPAVVGGCIPHYHDEIKLY